MIENPYKYVQSTNNHLSVTALLNRTAKEGSTRDVVPKTYFYLSELINPVQAYWTRMKPSEVPTSGETERKFALGKKIEKLASIWFKRLPDFILEQGKLDGAHAEVPGVVGRVDFLIGDSIIELKSKHRLPESREEVMKLYPQDVEQLAFYSVLYPTRPKENHLVFISQTRPYAFRVYKLATTDFGKIKSVMLSRIGDLRRALQTEDCSNLGRCRYFEAGCKFGENSVCSCESLKQVSDAVLSAVELSYDDEFTKLLQTEMEKSSFAGNSYTVLDMIAPRTKIMRERFGEDRGSPDLKTERSISFLEDLVRKLPYRVSREQMNKIRTGVFDDRLMIAQRWLNLPSSGRQGGEPMPYIVKCSSTDRREYSTKPNQFYLRHLGLVCAAYGATRGLIFVIYPALGDLIQTFEINFKGSIKELQPVMKETLDNLDSAMNDETLDGPEKAQENQNFSQLQRCPEFFGCECCRMN